MAKEVTSLEEKFWKIFFHFFGHFGQFQTFSRKKNFFPSDVTWSDEQMAKEVTSLEVTVIWKKWRHFASDEQMAKANISHRKKVHLVTWVRFSPSAKLWLGLQNKINFFPVSDIDVISSVSCSGTLIYIKNCTPGKSHHYIWRT